MVLPLYHRDRTSDQAGGRAYRWLDDLSGRHATSHRRFPPGTRSLHHLASPSNVVRHAPEVGGRYRHTGSTDTSGGGSGPIEVTFRGEVIDDGLGYQSGSILRPSGHEEFPYAVNVGWRDAPGLPQSGAVIEHSISGGTAEQTFWSVLRP